jgi:hypothetical protein
VGGEASRRSRRWGVGGVVLLSEYSSHPCEFLLGGGDADVKAFDLAGPAVGVGLVQTGQEVGVDLGESCELSRGE